jgi:alkylresorcinol/alkylpyrone synthase
MTSVRLAGIGTAYPHHWIAQDEAARWIGGVTGDDRRVRAIARSTQIARRAICREPDDLLKLKTIQDRNAVYHDVAPGLAIEASRTAIGCAEAQGIGLIVGVSCTGYMVPGWDSQLVKELDFSPQTTRLPITQAGCAGGVLALGRAADYLRVHPEQSAVTVSAELCSLAFHADLEPGNLMSILLFGDGAGAALLETTDDPEVEGIELIDSLTTLVPGSAADLGFELTNEGFRSVLSRDVADVLARPIVESVRKLLPRHELVPADIAFWLVHAGGPRILSGVENCCDLPDGALRWSWEALKNVGNTSSASIYEVMKRYLDDDTAPEGWGIVMAFGPGVTIELLLVRRCG